MSRIVKRQGKNGTTYQVRYDTPDGSERGSRSFKRRADADAFLKANDTDLRRGDFVDPRDAQVPYRQLADDWLRSQVTRPTTQITAESRLRNHILPAFGELPIGTIRRTKIQAWVKRLSDDGLAPSTVEAVFATLRATFEMAVDDQRLASSPCKGVRRPRVPKELVVPLPVEAVEALRSSLPPHLQATVLLGAGTGMRVSEVLGLTVDRIDFLRRTIRVDRQQVLPNGGPPTLGPPKTLSSVRTVAAAGWVIQGLAAHLAEFGEGPDRLLFQTNAAAPVRRNNFSTAWKRWVRDTAWPDATFHDLRHHHASLLIAAGCSVTVVQHQLGHASASETLDTYSHLWPEDDERVRDAVDRAWTPPESRPSSAHEG